MFLSIRGDLEPFGSSRLWYRAACRRTVMGHQGYAQSGRPVAGCAEDIARIMSIANPDMVELALRMLRESLPGLRAVYRFGSSGSVYQTPQSDLDLAVWCLPAVPDASLWWMAQALAAQCGRDVDVVTYV